MSQLLIYTVLKNSILFPSRDVETDCDQQQWSHIISVCCATMTQKFKANCYLLCSLELFSIEGLGWLTTRHSKITGITQCINSFDLILKMFGEVEVADSNPSKVWSILPGQKYVTQVTVNCWDSNQWLFWGIFSLR